MISDQPEQVIGIDSNILFIKERGKVDSGNEVSSKVMAAFADVPVGN